MSETKGANQEKLARLKQLQEHLPPAARFEPPPELLYSQLRDGLAKFEPEALAAVGRIVGQDLTLLDVKPRVFGAMLELWVHDGVWPTGNAWEELGRRVDAQEAAALSEHLLPYYAARGSLAG